jgi:glycosyltransferase involved in cell wall biosynthesis
VLPFATKVNDDMKWVLIAATNNEQVLRTCLLKSPEASSASQTLLQSGFASAASAYNAAIDKADAEILVFAHQDMYFPEGWFARLEKVVEQLAKDDPNWGVLGIWGVDQQGGRAGHVYCAGLQHTLGQDQASVRPIRTLDETVLILRKSSGLRFDEKLPGFHFYGTDICLEASRRGMKCYVVSAFCIHNTNGYKMLPWQFWQGYFFVRNKWKKQLPIISTCAEVTFWCWPALRWNILRLRQMILGRHHPGKRVADPTLLVPASR